MKRYFLSLFLGLSLSQMAIPALASDSAEREAKTPPQTEEFYTKKLLDLSGQPFDLNQFRGQIVLVNFWATWCAPCRDELPLLVETMKRYQGKDLSIVGITLEERRAEVAQFLEPYQVNYPILLVGSEPGLALSKIFGNKKGGIPFNVIIDKNGMVVYAKFGKLNETDLTLELDRVITR